MKLSRLTIYTMMGVIGAIAAGCGGNECYENHSALPLSGFYSAFTGSKIGINRLTIYGIGAPGDSMLYYDEMLNLAFLPFQLDTDTTTYVFAYMQFLEQGESVDVSNPKIPKDTISFIYDRKPWFVSPACGAMYFFDMKKVTYTNHFIDSVATEPTITNQNIENIKIFFNAE